jgi:hypothetical protein
MKLKNIVQTCYACPSQWNAWTEDGKLVYIRYRYGHFRVDVSGETVYEESIGDGLDGVLSQEQMLAIVEKI